MTLTLNLSEALEQYLLAEARRQGLAPEELAVQVLEKSAAETKNELSAADLIQSWLNEKDDEEQKTTGTFLIKALDEDRLSERKLFPPEMKGISW